MHDDIHIHICGGFAISVFVRDKQENVYSFVARNTRYRHVSKSNQLEH